MRGGKPDSRFPATPYLRDYLLVKKFGWTKDQIDNQPAVWLDWMLSLDQVQIEEENKQYRN